MLEASCHCGAIKVEIDALPDTLVQCTCSICRRYGALWAFCTTQTTSVNTEQDKLTPYIWGDKDIAFQHCSVCGCMTHYESLSTEEPRRRAVNARMLLAKDIQDAKVRTFDGADTWQFLD